MPEKWARAQGFPLLSEWRSKNEIQYLVFIFGAIGLLFLTMFICVMMKIYCATVHGH